MTTRQASENLILVLEGRVKGPWVSELEQAWRAAQKLSKNQPITVDLSAVSFADWRGRKLLLDMRSQGAKLVGTSSFLLDMLEKTAGFRSQGEN